jgi:hypothetical protein
VMRRYAGPGDDRGRMIRVLCRYCVFALTVRRDASGAAWSLEPAADL